MCFRNLIRRLWSLFHYEYLAIELHGRKYADFSGALLKEIPTHAPCVYGLVSFSDVSGRFSDNEDRCQRLVPN